MTPEDARALPGDTVPERLQGPAVIYRTAVFLQDGRLARPSLPTRPGTDGTIGRDGWEHCRSLRSLDMVRMLKTAISLLPTLYICIDALDECTPKIRQELLGSLRDIARESPSTRVLFTGRSHVAEEVKKYFAESIIIPVSPTEDDIRAYLDGRLDGDTEPHAMDDDLRRDIMRIIPETISEV